MKQIRRIERSLDLICCVHLALLDLCLALSIALLFPGDNVIACLLWAFGTVIPVLLIQQICLRVKSIKLRYLYCAIVLLAAILIPNNGVRRTYYILCCAPILVSGLWLSRPQGRLVLSTPKLWHPIWGLLAYSFGKITKTPLMSGFAIGFCAMMVLTIAFYINQERVLRTVRDTTKTEVSFEEILRLNRKVTVLFAILGILALTAVPFLLQRELKAPVQEQQLPLVVENTVKDTSPLETKEILGQNVVDGPIEYFDFGETGTVLQWVFVSVIVIILLLIIFAIISALMAISDGNGKHTNPEREEKWIVESLPPKEEGPREEPAVGYEKKIRRRYEKLIRGRTSAQTTLSSMTPTEQGSAAELHGPAAQTVLELYHRTRYSTEPATKETYTQFKEAVHSINSH